MSKMISLIAIALLLNAAFACDAQAKKLFGYTAASSVKTVSASKQTKTRVGAKGRDSGKIAQTAQLNKALQSYAEGKYKESATGLEYVDSHGGCCDKVHYFLGLDYQNLNQTVLAQMHYQWVTSNSKNARLRQYADAANENLAYYQAHRTYGGQGGVTQAMSFG